MIPIPFFNTDLLPLALGSKVDRAPKTAPAGLKPAGREHLFVDDKGRMLYLPPEPAKIEPAKIEPAKIEPAKRAAMPMYEVTAANCHDYLLFSKEVLRSDSPQAGLQPWRDDTPPADIVGWFNCSCQGSSEAYRYWNGEYWSLSVKRHAPPAKRADAEGRRNAVATPLRWRLVVPVWSRP